MKETTRNNNEDNTKIDIKGRRLENLAGIIQLITGPSGRLL
jgi:hypothetical protein